MSRSLCDCYLTRSCVMHADLEPFMTECRTLWEECDRETMRRWQYLDGASRGLNDIFAPHRSRGFMAEGRPRSSQHQPVYYHLTILTQACVLITAHHTAQASLPHQHSDCCGFTHWQSVERSLAALVYAHRMGNKITCAKESKAEKAYAGLEIDRHYIYLPL